MYRMKLKVGGVDVVAFVWSRICVVVCDLWEKKIKSAEMS